MKTFLKSMLKRINELYFSPSFLTFFPIEAPPLDWILGFKVGSFNNFDAPLSIWQKVKIIWVSSIWQLYKKCYLTDNYCDEDRFHKSEVILE